MTLTLGAALAASSRAQAPEKHEHTAGPVNQQKDLRIEAEPGKVTTLKPEAIAKLPRLSVKVNDHGKETVFEGVKLAEVLKLSGVDFSEAAKGKRLRSYLVAEAADKYSVVYALIELDPEFTDNVVILADKRDGQPLPEQARYWQIVNPEEKRAGRWVRQVVNLKVVTVK